MRGMTTTLRSALLPGLAAVCAAVLTAAGGRSGPGGGPRPLGGRAG